MFGRLAVLPRRAAGVRPAGVRLFSDARPMTRFDQYPFDKTKMDEVRTCFDRAAGFPGLTSSQLPHRKRVTRALVRWRQVRAWVNESDIPETLRATPGVQDVQFSFCPGEGWLAARYIFDDLDDLRASFEAEAFTSAEAKVTAHPLYDASREPHIFKGFFLPEV